MPRKRRADFLYAIEQSPVIKLFYSSMVGAPAITLVLQSYSSDEIEEVATTVKKRLEEAGFNNVFALEATHPEEIPLEPEDTNKPHYKQVSGDIPQPTKHNGTWVIDDDRQRIEELLETIDVLHFERKHLEEAVPESRRGYRARTNVRREENRRQDNRNWGKEV